MRIRKGDKVKVLYGVDSGKVGVVVKALPKKNMVVVEGVNIYKKHLKGDGQSRQSEIVDIVKPLPVSKVQLIDPSTSKPTRVGYKLEGGKKVRFSKVSGKVVESARESKTEKIKENKAVKKETKSKGKSDKTKKKVSKKDSK